LGGLDVENVHFQSYIFLYSVYGGILIGIFYDIYRALRGRRKRDILITSAWDVFFLLAVLIIVMWTIFSSSYGEIRAYVFIGFLVGFYMFERLLGRILVRLVLFLYRSVATFLKTTNSILALPIKLLISFLYQCARSIGLLFGRGKMKLRKIKKLPKQVIYDYKRYHGMISRRIKKGGSK
jgi:spore cortex biosynthesis protein YabQ